jgi:hypothetical protein
MVLTVIPPALVAFAVANTTAGESISASGSSDSGAMLAAAAAALGPIGAGYLAAYAPAQANNLDATLRLGQVHAGIGTAAAVANTGFVALDGM